MFEILEPQGDLLYVKVLEDATCTTDEGERTLESKGGRAIHSRSRFWPLYLACVAQGAEVRPLKPSDFHVYVGGEWIEDVDERESAEATASLAESDRKATRSVDALMDYVLNGTPLPQADIDRHLSRKVAKGKAKR